MRRPERSPGGLPGRRARGCRRPEFGHDLPAAGIAGALTCEFAVRDSESDLQARPVRHRKRESIEAGLTIIFAALAVSRWIEARTGRSIRRLVRTARRYRTTGIWPDGRPSHDAIDVLPPLVQLILAAVTCQRVRREINVPNVHRAGPDMPDMIAW